MLQKYLEIQVRYYAARLDLTKTPRENSCFSFLERSVLQQDINRDSVRNPIAPVWRGKSRSQTRRGVALRIF